MKKKTKTTIIVVAVLLIIGGIQSAINPTEKENSSETVESNTTQNQSQGEYSFTTKNAASELDASIQSKKILLKQIWKLLLAQDIQPIMEVLNLPIPYGVM